MMQNSPRLRRLSFERPFVASDEGLRKFERVRRVILFRIALTINADGIKQKRGSDQMRFQLPYTYEAISNN